MRSFTIECIKLLIKEKTFNQAIKEARQKLLESNN